MKPPRGPDGVSKSPAARSRARVSSRPGPLVAIGALALTSAIASCTLVSGVDDYKFATGGAGGKATSVTTVGATTTSSASTGSGGDCGAAAKQCGGSCVTLDHPELGCDSAGCAACASGSLCCPSCADVAHDPLHCGGCTTQCANGEWCNGSCTCRPGLQLAQGNCIDPTSNPQHCGGSTACSGTTDLCQQSNCVSDCTGGFSECNGGCVDKMSDPLHCGSCQKACATNEVCVQGTCESFVPAAGCTTCPCPSACAGAFDRCCSYPKSTTPICVSQAAGACPT